VPSTAWRKEEYDQYEQRADRHQRQSNEFLVIGVERRQRPRKATRITEGFSEDVMFAIPARLEP